MTDKELNIALREMARERGLCDKWYEDWSDDDSIDLCLHRYITGFDFAVKADYPPLDFSRRYFRKEDLRRSNIYLDEELELTADRSGYYAFVGDCQCMLTVKGLLVVTVFVRHASKVTVNALEGAKVFVRTFDDAKATVYRDQYSTVFNKHRSRTE